MPIRTSWHSKKRAAPLRGEGGERRHRVSTATANGQVRNFPATATAVGLLRKYFLNRTDQLAFLPPWGKNACPMAPASLDGFLEAHIAGDVVDPQEVTWYKEGQPRDKERGYFRGGTYSIKPKDNTTRFMVI